MGVKKKWGKKKGVGVNKKSEIHHIMSSQMKLREILLHFDLPNRTNKQTHKQTDKHLGSIVCRNRATLASGN